MSNRPRSIATSPQELTAERVAAVGARLQDLTRDKAYQPQRAFAAGTDASYAADGDSSVLMTLDPIHVESPSLALLYFEGIFHFGVTMGTTPQLIVRLNVSPATPADGSHVIIADDNSVPTWRGTSVDLSGVSGGTQGAPPPFTCPLSLTLPDPGDYTFTFTGVLSGAGAVVATITSARAWVAVL